jgi:hypothetical protein
MRWWDAWRVEDSRFLFSVPGDSVAVLRHAGHSIRNIVSRQRLFDIREGSDQTTPISLRSSLWVSMKIIRLNQPFAHQRLRRGFFGEAQSGLWAMAIRVDVCVVTFHISVNGSWVLIEHFTGRKFLAPLRA